MTDLIEAVLTQTSTAKRLDVFRDGNRFDAVRIAGRSNTKGACFAAFAQHILAAHHHVLVDENLALPLFNAGVDLQRFSVSRGPHEFGVDF